MFSKIQKLLVAVGMFGALMAPVLAAPSVVAVDVVPSKELCQKAPDATVCQDEDPRSNPLFGPDGIVTVAVRLLSLIVGVLAVFIIIFQAIRIITANGDSQSITTARNGIIYALVGVIVAALSQAIVAFVLSKL